MFRTLRITALLLALAAAPAAASTGGAQATDDVPVAVTPSSTGGQGIEPTASASGGAVAGAADSAAPAPDPVPAAAPAGPIFAADVPYGPLIATTARRYGLSVSLFTALVWQESGFNARARSRAGARGLTQLMPGTARELGVRHVYDPAENLDGGARYLVTQIRRFASVELGLAAYNAGPNAVYRAKGIPKITETRRYVRNIVAIERKLRAAGVR